MKIMMALMGLEIGGAETHVIELSRALSRMGHDILIASNGGAYEASLEGWGIRHVKIPMHARDPKKMLQSLQLLRQTIRKEKPDLVHAHARIPAFLCGILHKTMKFPFITSAHWVFTVTPLLRLMTNWGERSVAVSQDIKEYLIREYGMPANRIHVTINGIDTEAFSADRVSALWAEDLGLGGGPVVAHVSRLDESRALAAEKLLEIAPALGEQIPGVQLLIVGGGDREQLLRETAEKINREAGRNLVVMTGARTDVADLVALGDVFVGVSRAALEAMAAEKPTILAGNEGYMGLFTRDTLAPAMETNFCCRGYEAITGEKLLEDLTGLLNASEGQRAELGALGRRVILDHYSVDKMAKDYLLAYDALLRKPVKAVLSGYYGYDNLGDDAILRSISRQLSHMDLTVLSKNPKETSQKYGLRAIPRFSAFKVPWNLLRCDVLISGGGSLLQDSTSTRSLMYYLSVIRGAQLLGKPVFLYANGIGPISGERNRRLVAKVLKKCRCITLRDGDSAALLSDMGIADTVLTGDPAFILSGDTLGQQRLRELGVPEGRRLLGVSLRKTVGGTAAVDAFAQLLSRVSRELGMTVLFVVMQEEYDRALIREIREKMEEESFVIATPNDPEAMLGMIRHMDLMLSMRLHTIIFAARERVPVVGCVYDPKVRSFLNMLGMPSCGSPENMDPEETFLLIRDSLSRLEEMKAVLEDRAAPMETLAARTPELLKEMLNTK